MPRDHGAGQPAGPHTGSLGDGIADQSRRPRDHLGRDPLRVEREALVVSVLLSSVTAVVNYLMHPGHFGPAVWRPR